MSKYWIVGESGFSNEAFKVQGVFLEIQGFDFSFSGFRYCTNRKQAMFT